MKPSTPNQYRIEHRCNFHYETAAHGSVMLLRLYPREDAGQQVLDFDLRTEPLTLPVPCMDAFGNRCHLINIHRMHQQTVVHARTRVAANPDPQSPVDPDTGSWKALAETTDRVHHWVFLNPSRFVYVCEPLKTFVAAHGIERGENPLSSLLQAASKLYEAFSYTPGSTHVDSTIEHILETRHGVCQDYTHVLIAIGRSWGIPSRYVSGYLHLEGIGNEQTPAGASHAWAEFWIPGVNWVGIDPTNNTPADHRHIRMAIGRDYADAAPTQGTYFSGGHSRLEVCVTVASTDEPVSAALPFAEPANLSQVPAAAQPPLASLEQ